MRKLTRFLVLLAAGWLLSLQAFAAFPAPSGGYTYGGMSESAALAACPSAFSYISFVHTCAVFDNPPVMCAVNSVDPTYCMAVWSVGVPASVCPANSTGTTTCTCNAGFTESGSSCVANPTCQPGQIKVFNITDGWKRAPTDDFDGYVVGTGHAVMSICDGSCSYSWSGVEMAWVSKTPNAQGLYRSSNDSRYTSTGSTCSGKTDALDPQAPTPSCPGSVGEINGVTVCVGNASNPLPNVSAPEKNGSPLASGNPAAGPVPPGASGAERVPSAGSGGSSGGPAASGSGTVLTPGRTTSGAPGTEQAACGAPGQPVCSVKISEAGTPDGSGVFDASNAKLDKADADRNSMFGSVTSSADKNTGWGVIPSWLTSGSCAPAVLMTLPANMGGKQITLDICPHLPLIYTLMNFLWSVWTFFIIVGMVGRVTSNSSS